MYEIKKQPRLDWQDGVGALLIYVGTLLFLVVLHVQSIDNPGNVGEVYGTVFSVMLMIYIGFVIFGIVGLIVHLLRWLTWSVTTSDWEKKKLKGGLQ